MFLVQVQYDFGSKGTYATQTMGKIGRVCMQETDEIICLMDSKYGEAGARYMAAASLSTVHV